MSKNGLSTEYYGGVFKFWYNQLFSSLIWKKFDFEYIGYDITHVSQ